MILLKKSTLFKVFAVTNFVVLISLFLLYRNGSLFPSDEIFTSPNGGAVNRPKQDTLKNTTHQFDTIRREIPQSTFLPSSKSLILIEENTKKTPQVFEIKGSALEKKAEFTPAGAITLPYSLDTTQKRELMFSTKSGAIFRE